MEQEKGCWYWQLLFSLNLIFGKSKHFIHKKFNGTVSYGCVGHILIGTPFKLIHKRRQW